MTFTVYFDESLVDRWAEPENAAQGKRSKAGRRLFVGAVVVSDGRALEMALAQGAHELLADSLTWELRGTRPGGKDRRSLFAKEGFHFTNDNPNIRNSGLAIMLAREFRAHVIYSHLRLPGLNQADMQTAMYFTLVKNLLQRYSGSHLELVFENESTMDSRYGQIVKHAIDTLDRANNHKRRQPRASVEARISRKPNGGLSTVDYCLGAANLGLQARYADGREGAPRDTEREVVARLDRHLAHVADFDLAIHRQRFDMLGTPSWARHISGANSHSGVVRPFSTLIASGPTGPFSYIGDEKALAVALGVTEETLQVARQLATYPSSYRFPCARIRGKWRHFTVPTDELLIGLQRRIQEFLQPVNEALHPACIGYVPGRRPAEAAAPHAGRKWIQKLDISNFFPSTTPLRVQEALERIGAQPNVASALADLTTHAGSLPTGARTSPLLSNLCLADFDFVIADVAEGAGLAYTRYADDLIFSGDGEPFDMTTSVGSALAPMGYRLNARKTVTRRRGQPVKVAGFTVFELDGPRLPRRIKQRLRLEVFNLEKALEVADFEDMDDEFELETRVARARGLVRYCRSIEPTTTDRILAGHPRAQPVLDLRVDVDGRTARVSHLVGQIAAETAPRLTEVSQPIGQLPPIDPLGGQRRRSTGAEPPRG